MIRLAETDAGAKMLSVTGPVPADAGAATVTTVVAASVIAVMPGSTARAVLPVPLVGDRSCATPPRSYASQKLPPGGTDNALIASILSFGRERS